MKFRFIAALLTLTLVLMTFSGCALIAAEAQLDAAEDAIEQRAEQVEEQVESAVKDAVIRSAEGTKNTPTQSIPEQVNTKQEPTNQGTQLTAEEAKQIALEHAGVDTENAERLYAEYEIDDRVPQYDVSFWADRVEYEYEIQAETGDILSFDRDR